jgi:hypothetical protein
MRNISTNGLTTLAKRTGNEPIIIIEVDWGDGPISYADRDLPGQHPDGARRPHHRVRLEADAPALGRRRRARGRWRSPTYWTVAITKRAALGETRRPAGSGSGSYSAGSSTSATPSPTRTAGASCTATSSRPTSC